MGQGLLEKLAEQIDILYLSDLRATCCRKELIRRLAAVRAEEYSSAEWADAIRYLTDNSKGSFGDVREARDYLIEQLKK